jgi:hypothetical protein
MNSFNSCQIILLGLKLFLFTFTNTGIHIIFLNQSELCLIEQIPALTYPLKRPRKNTPLFIIIPYPHLARTSW